MGKVVGIFFAQLVLQDSVYLHGKLNGALNDENIVNPALGSMQQTLLDKHYLRKHGKYAYYGQ